MPRDLHAIAQENSLQTMPALTKSPEEVDDHHRSSAMDAADEDEMIGDLTSSSSASTRRPNGTKRDQLHPYTQALSVSDVDSCTRLEEETFPPHERATREKVGLFLSHLADDSVLLIFLHPVRRSHLRHALSAFLDQDNARLKLST